MFLLLGQFTNLMSKKNLHVTLNETVYCQQPSGFEHPSSLDLVCLLNKFLYGLKQAPRAWFIRFDTFIQTIGFIPTKSDSSLLFFNLLLMLSTFFFTLMILFLLFF
jgi:hypothetical protein